MLHKHVQVRTHIVSKRRNRVRPSPIVRSRECRDTAGSVRECTRAVGGVHTLRAVGLCLRHLRYVYAHTRSRRSQTISTACVRHFSSVWVCRPTARIKTRDWGRSGADCRSRLFCSIRGQRVNPRPGVT